MNILPHLLAAAVAAFTLTADALAQPKLYGGFRGGLNIANASLDPDFGASSPGATHSSRLGPVVGGTLEYEFSPSFAVGFEMQYAQRGVVVGYTNFGGLGPATGTITLDYLEFPLLARLRLGEGTLRGVLFAGPNIALNLSAGGDYKYDDTTGGGQDFSGDMDDYFQRADVGLDVGGGIMYETAPGIYLLADVRYTFGLTDATQSVPRGPETWNTRDIKIMGGVLFHLWTARR